MTTKVLFTWSSGKDSALSLHRLQQDQTIEVSGLLTTVTAGYDRVSMHGVRRELLEQQAERIGLPLHLVTIPQTCTSEDYERLMQTALEEQKALGVEAVAFGDIFLEDLRRFREEKLALVGLPALFPIWKEDTTALAEEMINSGFVTTITCADSEAFAGTGVSAEAIVGRQLDHSLLADLPASIDPCGENGEFHSFVHEGPIFNSSIPVVIGEKVLRDERFWYCDLLPNPHLPGTAS